jgi:hypothetical protein
MLLLVVDEACSRHDICLQRFLWSQQPAFRELCALRSASHLVWSVLVARDVHACVPLCSCCSFLLVPWFVRPLVCACSISSAAAMDEDDDDVDPLDAFMSTTVMPQV